MRFLGKRSATVALLALNALLLVILVLQLEHTPKVATPSALPPVAGDVRLELPVMRSVMDSLDAYQEISERPLFWSGRRVMQELSAIAEDGAQTVMPFVLLGVVSGARAKALLGKDGGKVVSRVAVGDVVEGWRVEAVHRQGVVLVSGSVRKELQVGPGLSQGK